MAVPTQSGSSLHISLCFTNSNCLYPFSAPPTQNTLQGIYHLIQWLTRFLP